MDIDKIKKSSQWDPSRGDYPLKYISYEKKLHRRKRFIGIVLKLIYFLLLVTAVILLFKAFMK